MDNGDNSRPTTTRINLMTTTAAAASLTLDSPHHFSKQVLGKDADKIAQSFSKEGFCILSQVLDNPVEVAALKEWQEFGKNYFEHSFKTLYQNGYTSAPTHRVPLDKSKDSNGGKYVLGLGAKHGFREIVMRSPGRYELSLLHCPQDEIPSISCFLKPLESLLGKLLCSTNTYSSCSDKDLKLCHLSLLVATPGSSEQKWHADGSHVSISEHLPCHCYNVFIPLQDVPLQLGPTEFRPQGHFLTRNLGPMLLTAKCRKTLRPPVCFPWTMRDVVLFDYRILHRGKANNQNYNRMVLVMTFSEPWFKDILNFPKRSMLEPNQRNSKYTNTTGPGTTS